MLRLVAARAGSRALHCSRAVRAVGDTFVIPVPEMGDSITEGTIVAWEKQVGDSFAADEVVLVLETDKVSVDVRAERSGVVSELHADEDDTVEVGSALATCVEAEGGAPVAAAEPAAAAAAAPVAAAAAPAAPAPAPAPAAAAAPAPRVPSILFTHALRKDPTRRSAESAGSDADAGIASGDAFGPPGDVFQFVPASGQMWDPQYGRPKWTQAEIDTINGGDMQQL